MQTIPPKLVQSAQTLGGSGLHRCNNTTSSLEPWSLQPNQEGSPSAGPVHAHSGSFQVYLSRAGEEQRSVRAARQHQCAGSERECMGFYGGHILPRSRRVDTSPVAALQDRFIVTNKCLLLVE